MESEDNEVGNAASQPNRAPNLHSTTLNSQVLPMGPYVCADNNSSVFELCDEKPGCLPDYEAVSYPSSFFGASPSLEKLLPSIHRPLKKLITRFHNGEKMLFSSHMVKLVKPLLTK